MTIPTRHVPKRVSGRNHSQASALTTATGILTCKASLSPCLSLMSLSRLNHWLPGGQAHPEIMQGTAEFHHQIADTLLPQADPVFDDATALDTTVDMLDPQPTLVERLVGPLLLPASAPGRGVSSSA